MGADWLAALAARCICEWCGARRRPHAPHRISRLSDGPRNRIALCWACRRNAAKKGTRLAELWRAVAEARGGRG